MENNFDTIVAIITPIARSAVGIIRISGNRAFEIAQKIFSKNIINRFINYGFIKNNDKIIDEVILLPFRAPHSYTGEDVIEIQTHGNPTILNSIYDIIISLGARPALRGEFTKRAFLNHRIDLSQAEAVMDIIDARSDKSAQNALNNLSGYLKNNILKIKENLVEIYSKIIASIDFPEDVTEIDKNSIVSICNDNIQLIDNILKNSKTHDFVRDGINIALIGKPNAGKSSLFNALLNYNRAIVTEIEGTTRDSIKECINLDGYLINFVDTAGIRDKNKADIVEKIGIENSFSVIEEAQIILFLFENSIDEIDFDLKNKAKNKNILYIKTKSDLDNSEFNSSYEIIYTSAKTGFGIDNLKNNILNIIKNLIPEDTMYTTNKRQQNCLLRAKEALENVILTADGLNLEDLYANDLKCAILALDEITGEVLTDKILDNIFDNFCIGK